MRSRDSSVSIVTGSCAGNPKKPFGFSSKGKLATKIRSIKQHSEVANTFQLIAFLAAMRLLLNVKIWNSEFPCALPLSTPKSERLYWVMGQTFFRHLWSLHSRSENVNLWMLEKEVVVGDHCHLVYLPVIKWVTKRFVLLFVNTEGVNLVRLVQLLIQGLEISRLHCLLDILSLNYRLYAEPLESNFRWIAFLVLGPLRPPTLTETYNSEEEDTAHCR